MWVEPRAWDCPVGRDHGWSELGWRGSSKAVMIRGWMGSPLGGYRCLGQPGRWCVLAGGFRALRCSLGGSLEASIRGVPIRPRVLNRLRYVAVEAEGLKFPKIHCGNSIVFAERLRTETGRTLGVRCPKREDGIQGLTCPIPSRRLSWQRGVNALQLP